jgi:NADH-quinone oxidoreductase subunit N
MLASSTIWMPSADDMNRLAPFWALAGTIVAVLVGALVAGRNWRVTGSIAALGAAVIAWLSADGMHHAHHPWAGLSPAGSAPMLVVDGFSLFFILLMSVFLLAVIGMWWIGQRLDPVSQAHSGDAVEFFVLLLGSAFGMSLMVSTTNLLMIVLAVESASLPSYGLAGFRKKHRPAAEAAIKYMLFGAVTSAMMIYGASLLYGFYHTLDLAVIARRVSEDGASMLTGIAMFAFLIGVAFKVSAVPFHFWCPDVFEGASIEVTTWLSVVSKAAGLGLMLRILSVMTTAQASPQTLRYLSLAIAVMAALTCTVGNFSAFRQTNLKRLLAFSSIAHAGYMLMAVAIFWKPTAAGQVHPGFSTVIAYLAVYLVMNLCAFGCVAMVYWASGRETLDAWKGLGWRNPLVGVMMAVCLFSLVGLPPMGGFIVKLWLLYSLYDAGLIWLIIVAVFNTLISLYYYARIVYAMWFETSDEPPMRFPLAGQLAVAVCAAVILLSGTLWVGQIKHHTDHHARDLYTGITPEPATLSADAGK